MARLLLRLRWSWRDLRARWLQVAAIALVIGIGSGVYSGLSSTSEWRRASYDESYARLAMWDLHLELSEGTGVDRDTLVAAARGIPDADGLGGVEARLVVATQVDATRGGEAVLVPGRLVGVDVADGGPDVARVATVAGRGLRPNDAGEAVAVLDEHFADHYDLPAGGRFTVSGGQTLEYVGRGLSPEYFIVIPPQGTVFGEANFAVAWAPIETVQAITGRGGQANDLVVAIAEGADRDRVESQLVAAVQAAFPDVGVTVAHREDDRALRTLYDDIDSDQQFNNIFAVLVLAGAAFAAFNLTGRIVDAQRREIGIGMALGVPVRSLAARPLLVGAQIALLGVAFGVVVGLVIQSAMASVLESFFPLPRWRTDFQPAVFARGAVLGFVLPLVAVILPVRRAVRVAPVDAIRTSHRSASGGLAPLLRRIPLPGRSVVQLPFRNVARAPRRAVLTALGIAASITTLVGVIGMIDSYTITLDRADAEILGDTPDRLAIDLEFAPTDSATVRDVLDAAELGITEPALVLGGTLDPDGEAIETFLQVQDLDSELWHPTIVAGAVDASTPGVVLARKAADDLGVSVGDDVVLRHPVRVGTSYRLADTALPVQAIHPNPSRFITFLDIAHADLFALDGIVNAVRAVPADGVSVADAQRALFGRPGVVSVQPVGAQVDAIREQIEEFVGIFRIVQVAVLVLALLIAFNATSINVDERRREHATMFAFGLPVRSVVGVALVESLVVGILGTTTGVVAGRVLVEWLTRTLVAGTLSDIEILPAVATSTIVTAIVLGILAVAIAPLLTVRKLRRMDIPSTLRVME